MAIDCPQKYPHPKANTHRAVEEVVFGPIKIKNGTINQDLCHTKGTKNKV